MHATAAGYIVLLHMSHKAVTANSRGAQLQPARSRARAVRDQTLATLAAQKKRGIPIVPAAA
eukprot:scaffold95967_cov63-Phaeocystis_antarctica.AAC.2